MAAPDRSYDSLVGLTDALMSLPERQRRAILLREWQGLSHGEIAERLEISHSAAETLIFRARRSLADALENPGKRSRFKALHVLDLGGLLSALKGLLAAGVGVKAATAVTVAALTTVTVVATDPVGISGSGERDSTAAPANASAPAPPAVLPTAVLTPSSVSISAYRPPTSGEPASGRADRGRAHGQATADAAKAKPKKAKATGPNANANGSGNGKALGKAKNPPPAPQSSNGRGTPASGRSNRGANRRRTAGLPRRPRRSGSRRTSPPRPTRASRRLYPRSHASGHPFARQDPTPFVCCIITGARAPAA